MCLPELAGILVSIANYSLALMPTWMRDNSGGSLGGGRGNNSLFMTHVPGNMRPSNHFNP